MADHYQILGISDQATAIEIRAAFKKLAVLYHPDKNPGRPDMEERFKEINEAYQVLSNPYQKARYDLIRSFGTAETQYTYRPAPPPPPQYTYRRRHVAPEIDYAENWKATLYAFGFTFIVALVVMTVIGIKSIYDGIKEEERIAKRWKNFEKAQKMYATGNLDSTFYLINQMGVLDQEKEFDMIFFRETVISETQRFGEASFNNGQYADAIYFLEMLNKHTNIKKPELKEVLALAYLNTGNSELAVYEFTQLLLQNYKKTFVFVHLAEIHRDTYGDYEKALFFFEQANISAKKYYEGVYGKAYNVILTGSLLPEYHYRLYTGLADIYLRLDQPKKAISVTEWNKQIWPDKKDNYLIASEGYRRLGNEVFAKNELKKYYARNQ